MLQFVYGSSELNLLRLPFFRNGKDPLEDWITTASVATRSDSHQLQELLVTYTHQPTSCVSNNTSVTSQ
ncbi:sucrose synthase family protein [Dorcoceras hygrometricum]|uniref:Sucrose synthase family protein n=1 Tax=Dorcoceras hygrometricum TaxID=472368 RepID=A0A2Z6ZXC4_9LAMI|nr:sucrose synthase family protein [Dorcoceras hygrometricum]